MEAEGFHPERARKEVLEMEEPEVRRVAGPVGSLRTEASFL